MQTLSRFAAAILLFAAAATLVALWSSQIASVAVAQSDSPPSTRSESTQPQSVQPQSSQVDFAKLKQNWWDDRWFSELPRVRLPAVDLQNDVTAAACNDFPGAATERNWWWMTQQTFFDGSNYEIVRRDWCGDSGTRLTVHPAADVRPRLNWDGTSIAFASNRDGQFEIYRMNPDGSALQRLTALPTDEDSPAWSRTGRIVYTSGSKDTDDEIWVMNSNGSGQVQLTSNIVEDFHPSWHPNGQQIVWVRATGTNSGEIWRMNADGSEQAKLTGSYLYLQHPTYSPDGGSILFDADISGDGPNDLLAVYADGTNLNVLQQSNFNPQSPLGTVYEYWAGTWAPDQSELYFPRIEYNVSQQGVRVHAITILGQCLRFPCVGFPVVADGFHLNPHVVNRDPYPPTSQVLPMANYTRRSDYIVEWTSNDLGPSGIASVRPEFRTEADSQWKPIELNFSSGPSAVLMNAMDGKTYFRTIAMDKASNQESPPSGEEGDTSTTAYSWRLEARLTDSRAIPQPNVALPLQPFALENPPTNLSGRTVMPINFGGDHLLNNQVRLMINSDRSRALYQLPTENLIVNGGFEANDTTPTWIRSDESLVRVSNSQPGVGTTSMLLGTGCVGTCFVISATETLTPTCQMLPCDVGLNPIAFPALGSPVVVADKNDSIYAIGLASGGLQYTYRTASSGWSAPVPLVNAPIFSDYTLAVDGAGIVYVAWNAADVNANTALSFSKLVNGLWSQPQVVSKGTKPVLIPDNNGGVHVLYVISQNNAQSYYPELAIFHRYANAASNLTEATPVTPFRLFQPGPGTGDPRGVGVVGDNGVLHMVVNTFEGPLSRLSYRTRTADGQWSPDRVIRGTHGNPLKLTIDKTNRLHLLWLTNPYYSQGVIQYASFDSTSGWSLPEAIHQSISGGDNSTTVLGDSEGALYLLAIMRAAMGSPIMTTRSLTKSGKWSDPRSLELIYSGFTGNMALAVGSPNSLHAVLGQYVGNSTSVSTKRPTETFTSTLSQRVTLSTTLHKPTLSFLYALEGGSTGASFFDVTITTEITKSSEITPASALTDTIELSTTQVFSRNTSTPWQLGWVEMSAWQSQTVTVTFALHQAAGDTPLQLYLDEVALGSWLTPVPQVASPNHFEFGVSVPITITGENFIATPVVKLGETALSDVQWLDEKTLRASLPATLAPGRYTLQVINPSGQSSYAQTIVTVGKQTHLPIIGR